jgi:hypothetical protein
LGVIGFYIRNGAELDTLDCASLKSLGGVPVIRYWIDSDPTEPSDEVRVVELKMALNKHERFSVIERSCREETGVRWHSTMQRGAIVLRVEEIDSNGHPKGMQAGANK